MITNIAVDGLYNIRKTSFFETHRISIIYKCDRHAPRVELCARANVTPKSRFRDSVLTLKKRRYHIRTREIANHYIIYTICSLILAHTWLCVFMYAFALFFLKKETLLTVLCLLSLCTSNVIFLCNRTDERTALCVN